MTVLPSQNKNYGFWGTCSNHTNKKQVQAIWDTAFTIIQVTAGFTPQEALALLDSRWGRHTVDEFVEEIRCDLKTFTKAFKRRMTKSYLYESFNYYVDENAYKNEDACRYEDFARDLARLSKRYGIVIQAIGGVYIRTPDGMKGFKGYTTDLDSGDLEPIWDD